MWRLITCGCGIEAAGQRGGLKIAFLVDDDLQGLKPFPSSPHFGTTEVVP
jgi:hypothetical protein